MSRNIVLIMFSVIFLASCANRGSIRTDVYSFLDPAYEHRKLSYIFVVVPEGHLSIRSSLEKYTCLFLRKYVKSCVTYLQLFPPTRKHTRKYVDDTIRDRRLDAILTMRIRKDNEKILGSATSFDTAVSVFDLAYQTNSIFNDVNIGFSESEGYSRILNKREWNSYVEIIDPATDRKIWVAETKTFAEQGAKKGHHLIRDHVMAKDMAYNIMRYMQSDRIIERKKRK